MSSKRADMFDVLAKLGIPIPATVGKSFRISSPSQSEKANYALSIMIDGNVQGFKDFVTSNSGGPIKFYAIMTGQVSPDHQGEIEPELYWKLNEEITGTKSSRNAEEIKQKFTKNIQAEANMVSAAPLELKDEIYRLLLKLCPIDERGRQELYARGFTEEDIVKYGYGAPPSSIKTLMSALQRSYPTFEGVPGFYYKDNGWKIDMLNKDCYLIPVRDLDGRIQRIKLKPLYKNAPKYQWLQSKKNLGAKDTSYSHFVGHLEETLIITEGPTKANVINKFLNKPVLAIPGVNCQGDLEDKLKTAYERGVRKIIIAYDMDKLTNEMVQKGLSSVAKTAEKIGISSSSVEWDPKIKGLDDYLLYLSKNNGLDDFKNFINSMWVY